MRTIILAGALALATLTGCAGLSERDQRVLSGAAIGGVVGNVVGGGSTAATVGGAVVGGAIGSQVDRDAQARERRRQWEECMRYYSRRYCDRHYGD